MQLHLISGFLGSGKTTAIQTACKILLSKNYKVGVITNDQGSRLVDTGLFKSLSIPTRQVMNGCFCCHYNSLDTNIQSLIEANQPDVIFAESVGSCTDLVATVMKPLLRSRQEIQVTISALADARLLHMILNQNHSLFDETVTYIYHKQLEDAGIIVINKTDLANNDELADIKQLMKEKYPQKQTLFVNALEVDSIQQWLAVLDNNNSNNLSSLHIDYNTYGAGEAMLAWLDEETEIYSNDAITDAIWLTNKIYTKIQEAQLPIGHVKFLINNDIKLSYTATTKPKPLTEVKNATKATLLINARVQTTPDFLQQLVSNTIREVEEERNCKVIVNSLSCFQPGYPTPMHRIAD